MLNVKILSIQYPERYVLRRLATLAHAELQAEHPGLEMNVTEIADPGQIGRYAFVIILPTLVVNEKVVCTGRFPAKEEVLAWLREASESEVS